MDPVDSKDVVYWSDRMCSIADLHGDVITSLKLLLLAEDKLVLPNSKTQKKPSEIAFDSYCPVFTIDRSEILILSKKFQFHVIAYLGTDYLYKMYD